MTSTRFGHWRIVANIVGVLACGVLAGAWGCGADDRIDLHRLDQIEDELRAAPAVVAKAEDLNVPEVKPFVVRAGDVLSINMIGVNSIDPYTPVTMRARVRADGNIALPSVGDVQVAGKDFDAVEQAIIKAHVPSVVQSMSCNVDIAGPKTTTVVVQGAAGQRGLVTLQSDQRNVLYALAGSQGWNGSGRVRVRPIRPERQEVAYDLNDMNDLRRAMIAAPLESGDMVLVEGQPPNSIYMLGLVTNPGPVQIPPASELSLARAVASAGGLTDFLEPKEGTLWRQFADGRQVRVKVPVAKILAGEEPDIALRGGDILEIPHTLETRMRDWILQNIRIGPFSLSTRYDPLAQYNIQRFRNDNRRSNGTNGGNSFRNAIENSLRLSVPDLLIPTVQPPVAGQ
ncbi:MAG: polysaccharide biosynthesis/export family protein [Phycisphaerae bacterium]